MVGREETLQGLRRAVTEREFEFANVFEVTDGELDSSWCACAAGSGCACTRWSSQLMFPRLPSGNWFSLVPMPQPTLEPTSSSTDPADNTSTAAWHGSKKAVSCACKRPTFQNRIPRRRIYPSG